MIVPRGKFELTHTVMDHLGIDDLSVIVLPDTVYGWNAFA